MAKKAWRSAGGSKRLKRRFAAVPKAGADGARRGLRKNGNEAKHIIRGDAPRDDGDLQASVNWSWGDPPPGVLGSNDVRHTGIPEHMRISIYAGGPKAPHAHLVHNGTAPRTAKDGGDRGVMPAQPFFWPNIRSLRRRFKGRISRFANKGIKDSVK